MLTLHKILAASLLLTLVSSFTPAQPIEEWDNEDGIQAFKNLLAQVDATSLHEALHSFRPKKFKHGMFESDHTAVEVIHKEEPSVATRIIELAKRTHDDVKKDMAKRQDNGTVTTTSPVGHLSVTPVPPIAERPLTTSGPVGSESAAPTTSIISSNGSPVVGSTILPVAGGSSTTFPLTSVSTGSISLTAGEVITSTNDVGAVIVSTVGGSAHTIATVGVTTSTNTHAAAGQTTVVVMTKTDANGSKSVVTAVTVVDGSNGVGETPSGTAGVSTATSTGNPGLQTGEAVMTHAWGKEMVLVVGGAVAVAGLL